MCQAIGEGKKGPCDGRKAKAAGEISFHHPTALPVHRYRSPVQDYKDRNYLSAIAIVTTSHPTAWTHTTAYTRSWRSIYRPLRYRR